MRVTSLLISASAALVVGCSGVRGIDQDSVVNDAPDESSEVTEGRDVVPAEDVLSPDISDAIQDGSQDTAAEVVSDSCMAGPDYCDGVDNDCDGSTDEDPTPCMNPDTSVRPGTPCASGVVQCVNGQSITCISPLPQMEACDGIDNDCNGIVDNDVSVSSCGNGLCSASGSCVNGQPQCTPQMDRAIPEVCSNRTDDDCDGIVDEQPCSN